MDIKVKIEKENKDGSADARVSFDKKGLEVLVQWGLVAMLTAVANEYAPRPEEDSVPVIKGNGRKAKKKKEELDIDGRC